MKMTLWELPLYEHVKDDMNISVVLLYLLTYQGQHCSTLCRLGYWWSLQDDQSILPNPTCAGFFFCFCFSCVCLHHCVRPLYSSRLPLSLIGGRWGESRSQQTLEYIQYTHQQEGEHGSWDSISLTKWTRRLRSATKKRARWWKLTPSQLLL